MTEQSFLENLHELDHKINFVKEKAFNDFRCCNDVKDVLDKLKLKVSYVIEILTSLCHMKFGMVGNHGHN